MERCQCHDSNCPEHEERNECNKMAFSTIFRSDTEDSIGTPMCYGCLEDSMKSGLFRLEGD